MAIDIIYEFDEVIKKCKTKCPYRIKNPVLESVYVGSTYCLHNLCGYNNGFDTSQKIVTCSYEDEKKQMDIAK